VIVVGTVAIGACAAATVGVRGAVVLGVEGGGAIITSGAIGASVADAAYAASTGKHTFAGYLREGAVGALSGSLGGVWAKGAIGVGATRAWAGSMTLGAAFNGVVYQAGTPVGEQSPIGMLATMDLGALESSYDPRVLGLRG
jgi:hypothetical protein